MNSISDYLTVTTPLPRYLPYARFLLDTDLSHTAKLLYTLLLDRATLSQKNNWIDAQGRIYVLYPLSSLAKDLGCSISSITRSFTELENAQLVERIRSGFSKPSRILLKVPHTTQNCTVIVSKNAEHDCAEMSNMIAQKCTPNQRNKNDLKDNHLIKTTDAHLTFGEYRNVFLTEKEYKRLKSDFSGLDDLIEQLSAYIHRQKVRRPCRHPAHLDKAAENRTKIDTGHPGLHIQRRRKPIKTIEKILEQSVSSIPKNTEDYYGKDGLLYCGKCHTPREAFFAKGVALMGKNKHPVECSCQRTERKKQEALINQQKHLDRVRRLKAEGFSDPAMLDWTFENDNGRSPQMYHAHRYVEQWQAMRSENLGLLLWGGVGTGKSFLAGCIANALIEQEVPVHMTNFARILNELNSSFSGRNEVVDKLCRYPLLVIDDFGMERGTEYALEQVYNIVDSRYRSQKPLIVTTNLTLDEIRHPQDTAHARIYDRLLEMCVPISCIGVSLRKENAQEKLERLKLLIG